jgi:hypothetical protein
MIPNLVRTPEDLKAARKVLGLSADGLARMLRIEDGRTIRRWEAGERDIPGPVTVVMETVMGYLAKKAMIARQLEMLRSGEMRSGKSKGTRMIDDTQENIKRLVAANAELDGALAILTRQPSAETGASTSKQVHWYDLRRLTPKFEPPEKDDWSVPTELSREAALAYFDKHENLGRLEICAEDDLSAEFLLEQREVLRSQHGISQRLSRGAVVNSFFVRRA